MPMMRYDIDIVRLPAWMLRLLGQQNITAGHITPATPLPWYLIAGVLLAALVWFTVFYYKDGTRPSWWVKGPLVGLRLFAVAVLLVVLTQPTTRLTKVDTVRPSVAIIVDNSASVAVPDPRLPASRAEVEANGAGVSPDRVRAMTRLERASAILNKSHALVELSKKYNVRTYTVDSVARQITLPADAKQRNSYQFALQPDPKTGNSTQLGVGLRRALDDMSGQPVAGMLLMSDGGNNLGEDPAAAADSARQSHVPVSALGIGDPTKTKDVSLLSVLADDVVRVNNTVTVYAAVSHRGYKGRSLPIILQRDGIEVQRQNLTLGADEQKQEVHFTYTPDHAGRFLYTVIATGQAGEVTLANNKRSFVQTVIDKKLKVLYVEGEPRYEFRYLRNAIMRDTSLDFACLLLSGSDVNEGGEGNIPVKGFPSDEKSLFEYDIIVLGDVPRSYFSQQQLEAIRRFVEDRGASLLVIAGEQHMPHEYAGTPLEAVLPAVISPTPDPVLTDDEFKWQLTPEGKRSPITQIEDDPTLNARVWDTMLPGMFWAAGVPRAKPGATVLATHPTRRNADGPYPLVLTQPFGAGKCFLELVDSTWRWRWRVGDRYFYRYWGQVFRSLTPKELPGNSRFVQLNADRSNYRLGERVALNARLLDAYYHPIKVNSVTATITTEGGQQQKVVLQATPGSPGLYTALYQPERVGKYAAGVISPVNPSAKASAAFVVECLALEKQKPELDEAMLRKIASSGGGKLYAPDKMADWIKSLPYHPLEVRSEQEYELWDKPLWNAPIVKYIPLFLALFLLPLSIEWFVRKRKGML